MRTLRVLPVALLALLGACSSGSPEPAASAGASVHATASATAMASGKTPKPEKAAPCRGGRLDVSLTGDNGAAGTTYVDVVVTNTAKEKCSIEGYPTVALVDDKGQTLGQNAEHDEVHPVARLILRQGQSAHASIGFPNAGNFDPGKCTDEGTGINVTLPGAEEPVFFPRPQAYCPGFKVSALTDWE